MRVETFLAAIVLATEEASTIGARETVLAGAGGLGDLTSDYRSFFENVVNATAMDVTDGDEVDS